ncbi:MAG TPA: Stp1/IreP family PP2C-type Ser/Thr phosphatase [Pyrinomonadaceae bacterium]
MSKRTRSGEAAAERAAYDIVASVRTDKGCVRETNEDSGQMFRPADAAVLRERGVLVVVADGMGGHSSGEVASRMAVELVSRLYYEADGDAQEALSGAVAEANRQIYAASQEDEGRQGMGTTCTALALLGGAAFAAHVGDSRLYMLRAGQIYQLTEDDSHVMELVRHGLISKEEARTHEDKNVILRALGTAPEVEVSAVSPVEAREGDYYLLSSDGLHDLVRDEEIARVLAGAADVHAAAEQLIALAKERGGHDNITVGIVGLASPAASLPEAQNMRATREVEAAR